MASPAAKALVAAIEGYRGAHGGQQGHEEIMSHLDRVHKEVLAGKASNHGDSPGKREVGLAAGQRELPAERAHDGGEGAKTSNRPSSFANEHKGEQGYPSPGRWEERKVNATGPVDMEGNRFSVKPGPAARSGAVSFRTIAAQKGAMKEPAQTSGGNRHSQTPGPAAQNTAKVGNVAPPAKAGADRNNLESTYEKVPQYVGKEQLGGDRWERAAQGVRKRFAKV